MLGDLIQPTHLLLILVVALLVLGPKRLPEVGRGLGKGIRGFRAGLAGLEEQLPEPAGQADTTEPQPAGHAD
jgi:sec-independent protein translocase protein TatA